MSTPDTPSPRSLITKRQLAQRAQVSERTIDRMRRAKKAPPELKIGRQIRFLEDAAEAWFQSLAAGGQVHI
ncbi:helix-turn-helix domain-containing protein [Acidisphaera sp. S103]|uniref:helix-turn-helix transcriptional regulator n=1 Tax=Acidisphaera sp. S103 TaxID=1747223 RepID=UPI00131C108D